MRGKALRFFLIAGGVVLMSLIAAPRLSNSAQTQSHLADQDAIRLQKPLRHEVNVVLKLIQVVVTDKNGNPVTDLKKEDFALTDNGDEKKLTAFERHDLKVEHSAWKSGEAQIGETPLPASRLLNRKIIFLFDFATGSYTGVRKATEAALNFIDTKLFPDDELGVITFSFTKGLQFSELLTTDHKKIRTVISSFGLHSGAGGALSEEEKYNDQLAAGAAADARKASPLTLDRGDSNFVADRRLLIRAYFDRMMALAQALRYLPGKKDIVFFSSGITTGQLKGGNASPQEADLETDHRRMLTDIFNAMVTANAVIYPIFTGERTTGLDMKTTAASLMEMAAKTGGQYFGYAQNYSDNFEKFQTLTAAYYVLGYSINETWDGHYHKVKVLVSRPGCQVRAQAGYLNPKEFADYSELEKQIHLIDLALAEKPLLQEPLRFPMAALGLSCGAADNIGLAAEIPLAELRAAGMGRVEIVRLVFNAADEIVDSRRTEEDLRARKERTAVLASLLTAPPGQVRCRIVIRDLESGRSAVAGTSLDSPVSTETEVRVQPPLLLRGERDQFILKNPKPAKAEAGAASATPAEAFFLDPAQYVPDFRTALKRGSEIAGIISCTGPPDLLKQIRLTAVLFDKFKNEPHDVPLATAGEKTTSGARIFFIRFRVPDVESDEYSLIFTAMGPDGPLSRIVRDFVLD